MRVGIAKFKRECPACGKLIKKGERIAVQMSMGSC
ncbi:unnamed protein product, partial [marine sediment metagenome]